jgi:NADH-quinone oxidoreductase subunit L
VPMLIAWTGGITALFAATIAIAQNDIKKVLAYSTISQLGYMFLAVGTGAYVAAIFHMVTHALFKALLFLGSGSVIHGMNDEQDMRKMGKLFKFMPITASTFIIGALALSGVAPFAGFWSKDEILLFNLADSSALYIIGIATAILTAFYMTRQVVMVFFGEAKWGRDAAPVGASAESGTDLDVAADVATGTQGVVAVADDADEHDVFEPHESPPTMVMPLIVLAFLSVVGGVIQLPSFFPGAAYDHRLEDWLHPVLPGEAEIDGTWAADHVAILVAIAVACSFAGIAAGIAIYQFKKVKPFEPELFAKGWYYDAAISWFMGNPGRRGFQDVADFDSNVVDGAVDGVATLVRETSGQVRKGQTGYVRQYAGVIGIGVVLLLGWFVVIRGIL